MPNDPTTPTDSRPVLTQRQADWEVHNAGLRALAAARQSGGDPNGLESLADAAAETKIGKFTFTVTAATSLLLERISAAYRRNELPLPDMALAFVFAYPVDAWSLLKKPEWFTDLEDRLFMFANEMTPKEVKEMLQWFAAEQKKLDAGKAAVGNAQSPDPAQSGL